MKVGVVAVQGAFIEHEKMLESLGVECIELRKKSDITENQLNGIVLPGGESTVQGKLLRDLEMFDLLKQKIESGTPVLATCAGMILLAQNLTDDSTVHFGTLPVTVKRNAYGRQLGSFVTREHVSKGYENERIDDFEMIFIRAPFVEKVENPDVKILSKADDRIVAVRYKNQIALAFHPEMGTDTRIHKCFMEIVSKSVEK